MRKGVALIAVLLLISVFLFAIVDADEAEDIERAYQCLEDKVEERSCADLTIEEKVFSILSIDECAPELMEDAVSGGECWPRNKGQSSCDIEMTAKALIALEHAGENVTLGKEWLMDQVGVSTDLNWFMQIDNDGNDPVALECTVYVTNPTSGFTAYNFNIGEDKKISANAGPCLTRANNNYWFSIAENCFDRSFQITCDNPQNVGFISTLVYQEENSPTYHISEEVHTASSGGDTTEKVNSYCFLQGGSCTYLGSLWATLALDALDEPISKFIPYLTTLASTNSQSFPSPFLYILTGKVEYKTAVLNKQTHIFNEYYWEIPGGRGKYYDTALALLPFQGSTLEEKDNTKLWLFDVQSADGCWDNDNVLSTGFILYSIWGRGGGSQQLTCGEAGFSCIPSGDVCEGFEINEYSCSGNQICCDPIPPGGEVTCAEEGNTCIENGNDCTGELTGALCSGTKVCCDPGEPGVGETECELAGYSCGFSNQCTGGELLSQYSCGSFALKCCSAEITQTFCSDSGGEICSSSEYCAGGGTLNTNDLNYGEICCLAPGECELEATSLDCEDNLGYCSSTSCDSGYSETSEFTCSSSSQVCCVQSSGGVSPSGSYWWIWVLFVLVILVVVGILYRDKIKEFLQRSKAKRSGGAGSPPFGRGPPPRFPPSYERRPQMALPPRKIVPPSEPRRPSAPINRSTPKKSPKELDEVLKKLKEIGK